MNKDSTETPLMKTNNRETVTEEERWLIDGSDKEEDEGLTLTMLIPLSACIRLPILATR